MNTAIPSNEIEGAPTPPEGADTTHLSVIDRHGNAVSSTLTINLSFGSAMVAKGTGIVLNDEMDDFAAAPGAPNAFGLLGSEANAVAPEKRPLSSMTPTIVTQDGKVLIVAGSPGGSRIITTTLQVILHLLDFNMNVREAVSLPRVHHQWYPKDLLIEPYGMSPDTQRILEGRGHSLSPSQFMGNAQAIFVDPETNIRYGSSDSRGIGAAQGY
jgi:gamma-glutamyltranspeptidase/glutathione hydrolase